ncbi:hypothetical protein ACFPVT_01755 [Corynebacterium choanae]|uniref:Secreted protein n=1 Tax=Corynebacterium choanae TaxID=1862358 RepID=A0A3G6J3F1_9CORY|nr:hypothetical protein [Corynebacterium choanae]AZA12595.1 hypothetical protein CCHOA_00830 [Corynebacterium choanae]
MQTFKRVLTGAVCASLMFTATTMPAQAKEWGFAEKKIIEFATSIADKKADEKCSNLKNIYGNKSQDEIRERLREQRETDMNLVTNKFAAAIFSPELKAELETIADRGNDNLKTRLIECKVLEPTVSEALGSSKDTNGSSLPGFNTDTNGNKTDNGSSDNQGLVGAVVIIALLAGLAGAVISNPALAAQLNIPVPR